MMAAQERVLIVDDDIDLLHTMEIALRRNGHQVTSTDSPFAALEILNAESLHAGRPFSVMVSDLMMPGMDGISLIQQAQQVDPYLESIIVTAAGSIETAISALKGNGAHDYLLKPFESLAQLTLSVNRAAAHRQLRVEHEALQARLKAEAEWLQALISNTGDAILSADSKGVLAVVNPAAARLLGKINLVGCPVSSCLPPVLMKIINNWESARKQYSSTIEVPWSDGSIQFVSLTPVIHEGTNWQGWVMVIRDITHLKQLDEMKTHMLIEAALKIRLPLADAMNSLVHLNTMVDQGTRAADIIYSLNKIWGRVLSWTDDLLNLVRIDSSPDLSPAVVNLSDTLYNFKRDILPAQFATQHLQLEIDIPDDLPKIKADQELLLKVLQQLAIRAAIRSVPGNRIHIQAQCKDKEVWIEVCDQGPEVSETDLIHVFDKSISRMHTGSLHTGLELATVKALIKKMGGQVWIGGPGPIGSTVTLCLCAV